VRWLTVRIALNDKKPTSFEIGFRALAVLGPDVCRRGDLNPHLDNQNRS
jgi:hypothetical protein